MGKVVADATQSDPSQTPIAWPQILANATEISELSKETLEAAGGSHNEAFHFYFFKSMQCAEKGSQRTWNRIAFHALSKRSRSLVSARRSLPNDSVCL